MRLLALFLTTFCAWAQDPLLEKFLPRFQIAANECDALPAEFDPSSAKPSPLARNGAIYARAFPKQSALLPGEWMELHYYHLWARDCGKNGHDLDAEHVSALLHRQDGQWRAVYWYAAAHEATPCDASRAARAEALDAVQRGPKVWISSGKHASFLTEDSCRRGCQADVCLPSRPLPVHRIVPLDPAAPWVQSRAWPLRNKLATDFPDDYLTALEKSPQHRLVFAKPRLLPSRHTLGGANVGLTHTDSSLQKASQETKKGLSEAYRRVRRYLGR